MTENTIIDLGFLKAMEIIRPQNKRDQVRTFNYENQHSCNIIKRVKVRVAAGEPDMYRPMEIVNRSEHP